MIKLSKTHWTDELKEFNERVKKRLAESELVDPGDRVFFTWFRHPITGIVTDVKLTKAKVRFISRMGLQKEVWRKIKDLKIIKKKTFNCDDCGRFIDQAKEKPYYHKLNRVCIQCYYKLNPDKRKKIHVH